MTNNGNVFLIAECIRELLNNIGTHIDPLLIINQIPKGMEIPGLRDALVKILHDYQLQVCGIEHDSQNLGRKSTQKRMPPLLF